MNTTISQPLRTLVTLAVVALPLAGQANGWLPAGELADIDWQRMQVVATPVSQATPLPVVVAEVSETPSFGPAYETRAGVRQQFRQAQATGRLARTGEVADDEAVLQAREAYIVAQTEEILAEYRTINQTLLAQYNVQDATMLIAEGYVRPEPGEGGVAQAADAPPLWVKPEDETNESQAS